MKRSRPALPRWRCVSALAGRGWRSSWRTYRFWGIAAFALLTWPFRPPPTAQLEALAAPFIVAALATLVIGAGVVARDFDSGTMLLDRLHGARPVEVVFGNLLYTVLAALGLALLLLGSVVAPAPEMLDRTGWVVIGLGALAVTSMCCLLVGFGTVARGYANVAIVVGLLLLVPATTAAERRGVPGAAADALGLVRAILPLPHQMGTATRQLARGDSPLATALVFVAGSLVAALGAIAAVHRRDPVAGWRR